MIFLEVASSNTALPACQKLVTGWKVGIPVTDMLNLHFFSLLEIQMVVGEDNICARTLHRHMF